MCSEIYYLFLVLSMGASIDIPDIFHCVSKTMKKTKIYVPKPQVVQGRNCPYCLLDAEQV